MRDIGGFGGDFSPNESNEFDPESFFIEWEDFPVDDPAKFHPEVEQALKTMAVTAEAGISQIPTIIKDLRTRLEAMAVESPNKLSVRKIKHHKDLFLHPLALEDLHYVAFADKRRQEKTRYLSVSVADILKYIPDSIHQISGIQSNQSSEARTFLAEFGVAEPELVEMHDNGDRVTRFAMRSLHRLLLEYRLKPYLMNRPNQPIRPNRIKPEPGVAVPFHIIAHRSITRLDQLYDRHSSIRPKSRDARIQLTLDERDYRRSYSFAEPLLGKKPE